MAKKKRKKKNGFVAWDKQKRIWSLYLSVILKINITWSFSHQLLTLDKKKKSLLLSCIVLLSE